MWERGNVDCDEPCEICPVKALGPEVRGLVAEIVTGMTSEDRDAQLHVTEVGSMGPRNPLDDMVTGALERANQRAGAYTIVMLSTAVRHKFRGTCLYQS